MAKKKKNTARKESHFLKYLAWVLALIALGLLGVAAGYYIGYEKAKKEVLAKEQYKQERRLALLQKIEGTDVPKAQSVQERLKKVLDTAQKEKTNTPAPALIVQKPQVKAEEKNETIPESTKAQALEKVKNYASASHEYAGESPAKPPKRVKREMKVSPSRKPRLAIVIDDVSVRSQVEAVKSVNLPLTMSFLPPSPARPNSAKLAAQESFYMVHLPMEAQTFSAEEPKTLRIYDTQQAVSARVSEIQKLFPKVRYINNHTGSKYTENEKAMNRLVLALNSHNISFLDSRTTAKTQVPKVMKNFGLKYIARDVFLDHHMDKPYVKKQIKEAIRIAKSEGVAIAIGHPHINTIAALKESKELFKDVELVLINKVY